MRQLNLQGLFALLSVFSLAFVPIGLLRFAYDVWRFSFAPKSAHAHLNYQGLDIAGVGIFWFAVFLCGFFVMEMQFRNRLNRRPKA